MNLQDATSWVSIVKDVITTGAAVVAAGIAVKGLHAWKRQLHGNANYELSRRLLRAAYKVREAVRWVRTPFMSVGEMSAAMRAAGLVDPPDDTDKAEALAYQARWDKVVQAQLEFSAEILEAEAAWQGSDIRKRSDALTKCTGKLYSRLNQWVDRNKRPLSPEREGKIAAVIYDEGDDSEFSKELAAALAGIEEVVRSHLKP